MDSKIMDLIQKEISKLPVDRNSKYSFRHYNEAKQQLCEKYPGHEEGEHIAKELAKKFGI